MVFQKHINFFPKNTFAYIKIGKLYKCVIADDAAMSQRGLQEENIMSEVKHGKYERKI